MVGDILVNLLQRLDKQARRGSKPRCHWFVHGKREFVAKRLTKLAQPWCTVSPDDFWMPDGFHQTDEACLDKADGLLSLQERRTLRDWWLAVWRRAKTPKFDIASTCTVEGEMGLLLVEAKAHTEELNKEVAGKDLKPSASPNQLRNHQQIGKCIQEASFSLANFTRLPWKLSRDRCYQMSNRFAWSWKLTELGYPVILVYLGYVNADEMRDRGNTFANHSDWEVLVKMHSRPIVPDNTWDRPWDVHHHTFVPCIRSLETPFDAPVEDA